MNWTTLPSRCDRVDPSLAINHETPVYLTFPCYLCLTHIRFWLLQELDDICSQNGWIMPMYTVFPSIANGKRMSVLFSLENNLFANKLLSFTFSEDASRYAAFHLVYYFTLVVSSRQSWHKLCFFFLQKVSRLVCLWEELILKLMLLVISRAILAKGDYLQLLTWWPNFIIWQIYKMLLKVEFEFLFGGWKLFQYIAWSLCLGIVALSFSLNKHTL